VRNAIHVAMLAWSAPVFAVAAGGLGLTTVAALIVGLCLAAFVASLASPALHRRVARGVTRPLAVALVVAAAVAIFRIGTLAVFMADVNRVQYSSQPDDAFRRAHSCFSAYAESARFLSEHEHNIYERALYYQSGDVPRRIGPLQVDPFHYPPPFLLVPQAVRLMAPDFWHFRRIWFALQALTLAAAVVGLAAWIGGPRGAVALLAGLLVLGLPHVTTTFQTGNFQVTAIPLAALAFVLLMTGRLAVGGTLLAYAALAKIFPGILAVFVLAQRDRRRIAALTVAGIGLAVLTVATQGVRPFEDFVSTALPEISSGAAFPQTEIQAHARVNWTFYGETVRARFLGLTWLTKPRGLAATQVYGLLVVALAAWIGWKRRFDLTLDTDRVALLQVAVAMVSLMSFRSPFAGAVYGGIGTMWVMGLAASAASSTAKKVAWLVALYAMAWGLWVIPSPGAPGPNWWLWITGALMFACIAINVVVAISATPASPERFPHGRRQRTDTMSAQWQPQP
jgi:alpha-1,2-mannosyltransferase